MADCVVFGRVFSIVVVSGGMVLLSRMLPVPAGEGNWVSVNSVDADSILVWRSSKLTDGRKSWDGGNWSAE